ncbi:hypothetical protein B5807_07677 [Epicoccum nigrum]|uniref:Uncharacterized protein n=1 Tax=Epicoccum nigrum TaxID=105696 RepID=A0A1Y2LYG1_EPING|nr:hypothetical protein B5807_07677 [Epicoccum nigrum]
MAPRNHKNLNLDLSKAKSYPFKNASRVSKRPSKSTTSPNSHSRLNAYTQTFGEDGSITLFTRLNDTTTMTSAPDGALTIHSRNGLLSFPMALGMNLAEQAFKMEVAKWEAVRAKKVAETMEKWKNSDVEDAPQLKKHLRDLDYADFHPGYVKSGGWTVSPPPTPAPPPTPSPPRSPVVQPQVKSVRQGTAIPGVTMSMPCMTMRMQGAPGMTVSMQGTMMPGVSVSTQNTAEPGTSMSTQNTTMPGISMTMQATPSPANNENTITLPYRPTDHLNATGNIPPRALSPDWTKDPLAVWERLQSMREPEPKSPHFASIGDWTAASGHEEGMVSFRVPWPRRRFGLNPHYRSVEDPDTPRP